MARNIAHLVLWLRSVFDLLAFLVEIDFRHLSMLFFGMRKEQDFYSPLSSEKLICHGPYLMTLAIWAIQYGHTVWPIHYSAYCMLRTYSDWWGRSYRWRGWYPLYLSLWLHTLFNDRCQVWILISCSTYAFDILYNLV